jgi:hypothetical protein
MIPLNSFQGLDDILNKVCPAEKNRCLVALLFADNGFPLVKQEILPFLNRFHVRSARFTHFLFAGYVSNVSENSADFKNCSFAVEAYNQRKWYFNATAFEKIRKDLENLTSWKYSGGVDFLLFDAVREPTSGNKLCLQFDQVVFFELSEAREKNQIPVLSKFFEELFRYSENNEATIIDYSNSHMLPICASVTEGILKKLIPNYDALAKGFQKGKLFAVKDFRR